MHKKMFKDVAKPKVDETFKFAFAIIASVFITIAIAISYDITHWV